MGKEMDINAELVEVDSKLAQASGQAQMWASRATYLQAQHDLLVKMGAELPKEEEPSVAPVQS